MMLACQLGLTLLLGLAAVSLVELDADLRRVRVSPRVAWAVAWLLRGGIMLAVALLTAIIWTLWTL